MLRSGAIDVTPANCSEVTKTWCWGRMNHHSGRAPLEKIAKASDRMRAPYDFFTNFVGFQEGDHVLYPLIWTREKLLKLVTLVRPSQDDHPDQRCSLQDPASSQSIDGDVAPGQSRAVFVVYWRWVALRWKQCHMTARGARKEECRLVSTPLSLSPSLSLEDLTVCVPIFYSCSFQKS